MHADACYIGRHAIILNDHDRPVPVYVCDPVLDSQTLHTVSDFMAYMNPMTGSTYHIVIQ